ncbi:MAG: glycosyltransferase [Eubacteriales bacterium]|nr:glycosyltransferase [Eubacteriales bacterium]
MTIKVSIIIPAYNTEKYIAECLQSIVSQTLSDIEIIVINDGSTDGTGVIIDSFKARDSRIITINQINQGLSRSRNRGAGLATGEYLYFMDSDDFISPYAMEILYDNICESGASLIYGDYSRFYDGDLSFSDFLTADLETKPANLGVDVYDSVDFACSSDLYTVNVWRFMIQKKFWDSLPFRFIEGFNHEDCEFSNKMILLAEKVVYIDYAFHYYRQRQGSISYSFSDKMTVTSSIAVAKSLQAFYEHQQFSPNEKICYSTIISPDILRAVSLRQLYRNNSNRLVEDVIGGAFFHLKASKRLKHRLMYYLINLNIGLASTFLRFKYALSRLKMQVKSLL